MIKATLLLFLLLTSVSFSTLSNTALGQTKIVGISIACSDDHVYTWDSDRNVRVGTSENLSLYQPPHPYSLPFGKTPDDIVEIGIAGDDHVYVWYRDSTVSSGTSTDLDKYQPRHPFKLPNLRRMSDIVGIDIACSDDRVYSWLKGGLLYIGTSENLAEYHGPNSFSPGINHVAEQIVGIGIAGNDHVYVWYQTAAGSGTSQDLTKYRPPYKYVVGPAPCDISVDPPKMNGRSVFSVGIRGPSCSSKADVVVRLISIETTQRRILAEKRGSGSSFEVPVTFTCTGTESKKLIAEVESQGRIVKSNNSMIYKCF